jgi:type VI secretion system Hcp family effector
MADNIGLLTLTGTTQGKIAAGENTRKEGSLKWSDGIEVHAYDIGVSTPTDPSRLVVTGRATMKVLSIWKPIDSTSPKLFQCATTGEVITKGVLAFNKITPKGQPDPFYELDFVNMIVVGFQQYLGHYSGWAQSGAGSTTAGNQLASGLHDLERIDFVYEGITHQHIPGKTIGNFNLVLGKT